MHHVVDDRELGVQLGALIFVHLDMAAEQPAVAVPGGEDGRVIVGFRAVMIRARPRKPSRPMRRSIAPGGEK